MDNYPTAADSATSPTSAKFQINSTKLYFPVIILFINDNNKFLENVKQRFKKCINGQQTIF